MLRICICDNQLETCADLENMLYDYGRRQEIKIEIDVWYSGEGLCEDLTQKYEYDLIFISMDLTGRDGIKIGKYIREEMDDMETVIIYISSKANCKKELFRLQPLDFLVKPLKKEVLEETMDRSIKLCERKNRFFEYHKRGNYYRVPYDEIEYFYSQDKKINIVSGVQRRKLNGRLKEIAARVPHNFILIHQSYLINIDYVRKCSSEWVEMKNGALLSVSQPYRQSVRERIMKKQEAIESKKDMERKF